MSEGKRVPLGKEAIRSRVGDIATAEVEVPEWGGSGFVRIQEMRSADQDLLELSILFANGRPASDMSRLENFTARVVIKVCIDEHGDRIFEEADAEWLGQMATAPVRRIYEAAQRMNKITDKDVEEMVKNFGRARAAGSATGSGATSESGM